MLYAIYICDDRSSDPDSCLGSEFSAVPLLEVPRDLNCVLVKACLTIGNERQGFMMLERLGRECPDHISLEVALIALSRIHEMTEFAEQHKSLLTACSHSLRSKRQRAKTQRGQKQSVVSRRNKESLSMEQLVVFQQLINKLVMPNLNNSDISGSSYVSIIRR